MSEKVTSEYRNKIIVDLYEGRIPDRVPEKFGINGTAVLEWAGHSLKTGQFGYSEQIDAMDKFNAVFDTDSLCGGYGGAAPYYTKVIRSRTNIMGSDGFMQHPDVAAMDDTEYDDFIADPYKFLTAKAIPRVFPELGEPFPRGAYALLEMIKSSDEVMAHLGRAMFELGAKYNKQTVGTGRGISRAPFDYLADFLRAFTGLLKDIRRMPEKVLEATNCITPLMIRCGTPRPVPTNQALGRIFFALHMPTFMRTKDFQKFWWPSFKETIWEVYKAGYGISIFCEDDWTRYLDYLVELPPLSELQFEDGDPKLIKQKVGDTQIIQGLFPIQYLKNYSVEEACDKAKEVLDICAPGGQYVFGVDKSILRGNEIDWNKVQPFLDCVHEYGKYGSEAGKPSGHRDAQIVIPEFDDIKPFVSEYYQPLDKLMEYYDIVPEARQGVDESIGWAQDYLLNLTLTRLSN